MANVVSGAKILSDLFDFQRQMEDLTEALEHVRDHPGTREDIVYSPEMYHESANAAAIAGFVLQKAKEKHLGKQEWSLDKPLEVKNNFEVAIEYFTNSVTDRKIMVDDLSEDRLKKVLLETLETSIQDQREILTGLGYGPEKDPLHPEIEESYSRCFAIFADFVKLALN